MAAVGFPGRRRRGRNLKLPRSLGEVAKEENWVALADGLRAAMEDPEVYGANDPEEILREVARLRGVRPGSLRNPLAAAAWLESHAPEVYRARPDGVGRSHVQMLAQLHDLDPDKARELAPRVFEGSIRHRDLRLVLDKATDAVRSSVVRARPRIMRRAQDFHEAAEAFLRANPGEIGLPEEVEYRSALRDRLPPCDLEIWHRGRPALAVEIKAARVRVSRQHMVETLGVASLLLREFDRVLIVLAPEWRSEAPGLVALRDALGLGDIGVALLETAPDGADEPVALEFVGEWPD